MSHAFSRRAPSACGTRPTDRTRSSSRWLAMAPSIWPLWAPSPISRNRTLSDAAQIRGIADVLAAAIPRICAASDSVRFLLIGDGAHKGQIDGAIASHRLEDRVRSVGRVPQAEGARLLKACDIYVAPH